MKLSRLFCCLTRTARLQRGEYEEAYEVLSVFWPRIGERPSLEGLDQRTAAELLLRAGVLTGFVGSSRQITDAQEIAKNYVTESLRIFQSQRLKDKVAEAQTELALCYWRIGEHSNAADFLKLALAEATVTSEVKAKAVIRLAIVDIEVGRFNEGLVFLTDNAFTSVRVLLSR